MFLSPRVPLLRNFIILSAITTLFFVMLAVRSMWHTYLTKKESIGLHLEVQAAKLERSFSDSIDYTAYLLDHIVSQIKPYSDDNTYIQQVLRSFSSSNKQTSDVLSLSMFSWIDPYNQLTVNSELGILTDARDLSKRDYASVLKNYPRMALLGQPVLGSISKQWIIPVAMGLTDEKGRYLGAANVGINIQRLTQKLDRLLTTKGVSFIVVDGDQNIILESSNNQFLKTLEVFQKLEKINKKGQSGILIAPSPFEKGRNFVFFQHISKYPYTVLVGYDKELSDQQIGEAFIAHVMEFVVLGVMITLFLLFIRRRIISPILDLSEAADKISQGEKNISIPQSPIHEMQNLARQLENVMAYTEQLRTTQEKLKHANALVKSTLGYMAHELKTPLNQIIGFAELALKEHRGVLGDNKEYIHYVHDAGILQKQLIDGFLNAATYEEGKLELAEKRINLESLLRQRADMTRSMALEKDITVSMEIAANLPTFRGDEMRLGQALLNFISNAIKYNVPEGKIYIRAYRAKSGEVHIEVQDTGIGIAEKDQKRLFQRFERIQNGELGEVEGTGLGLPFAREVVELHGGSIAVKSVKGEGTTFTIILPANRCNA